MNSMDAAWQAVEAEANMKAVEAREAELAERAEAWEEVAALAASKCAEAWKEVVAALEAQDETQESGT